MKMLALLIVTGFGFSHFATATQTGDCGFGAASFETQLNSLRDTQERTRQLENKLADERDAKQITELGLTYVGTYASDAAQKAARDILKRNKTIRDKKEIRAFSDTDVRYPLIGEIIHKSIVGTKPVLFRQTGRPYAWRDHDGGSSNTWQYISDSMEGVKTSELQGKLVVFFGGYKAYAGVVSSIDRDGISIVNLDGEFEHHFFRGDRGRYAGIGHLHVFDENWSTQKWLDLQTQLIVQPMLSNSGIVHPEVLPRNWKSVDPKDGLFVTDLSYKELTKNLEKLLREKGTVQLLIVSGNLNRSRILGPYEFVELVGIDVSAPELNGKVGIIVKEGRKAVRKLYDITARYGQAGAQYGIEQMFYLNE